MRRLLAICLLFAIPSTLAAQRMGFARFSGRAIGVNRPGFGRAVYYPVPYLDSLYSGFASEAIDVAPPRPLVVMMQPAPATFPDPPRPSQPLMIELQGDHYVQISGDSIAQSQMIDRIPAATPAQSSVATAPPQPPSTILVFRDGHRQEVSTYTIADSALYAASDYYSSGSWNQKIALSSLNLPETMAVNHSRGVQFRLPASPNEVIVGP